MSSLTVEDFIFTRGVRRGEPVRGGPRLRSMEPLVRDRVKAAAGTAGVMAALGTLLVLGLAVPQAVRDQRVMALLDLAPPPPPPPAEKPPEPVIRASAARHAPSPRNLRNKATEVVAPPVIVPLPVVPPVVVAPVAGVGHAASAGASSQAGPGYGAGGAGDGDGGGGDGDGEAGTPPRLVRGRLKFSDLPPDLRASGRGGSVAVRYRVEIDGHVSDCTVPRSSGLPELDALTCRLIEERFRFKPSRDQDGQPVRSIVVETHDWVIDREDDRAGQ